MEEYWNILIFLFISVATLIVFSLRSRRWKRLPMPPGPSGYPIIGNMMTMNKLTHRHLAHLAQRYGGLFHLRLGLLNVFVVSTPDIAQQVLQVHDKSFANRPVGKAMRYLSYDRADMAFANYGPFWRQMRKLCAMRVFSRKRTESWVSVRDEVESTVRSVAAEAGQSVNIGELVFSLTMNITFRAAFGTTFTSNQDRFLSILQEFSKLFGSFNLGDFFPFLGWLDLQGMDDRLRNARRDLDRFIDVIIDRHINNPKIDSNSNSKSDAYELDMDMVDDMIDFLGESTDAGDGDNNNNLQGPLRLTKNNIKAIIMDVMFGGTETVGSAIEWALAELIKNPEDMRRVQEELVNVVGLNRKVNESDINKLLFFKCCIKETLRLHPPIPLMLHESIKDCEVSGYFIPAKSRVMINAWAIGRDKPAWGHDADTFRPSRFMVDEKASGLDFRGGFFQFIPFGSGRRSCPGMQLGLYGLEMSLSQLLHCFTWNLPHPMKPSELDMGDVFGLTAPRAVRLVAVPTPRLNCSIIS